MNISDSLCLTVTTLFRSTSFISMIYFTDVKPDFILISLSSVVFPLAKAINSIHLLRLLIICLQAARGF